MTKTPTCGRGDLPRALIFIPLGLCLLYLTLWLAVDRTNFLARAQRAEGHVSALNAGGSHPQVDFTDAADKAVSYPQGGFIFGYSVGDPVTVLYLGEAPPSSTAIIEDQGALWGASLLTGLFAIVFTAGGGYHMAAWIRRRRTAR
ncbi:MULTISPECIES: DUF3592 domain-containing protein [Pseudomonas syringae group]|uniref:DUF3592 domain-containing protein n=4 Tax=Pseudomonas syringae group TaxID=136849 RepID=A0AAD0DL85_9PSED|nr:MULTISPECIES: DUF3592 domain-containing protein [Pseudomonas syringae group]AVB17907.1 DUF3592 domain-containing protein [Pseudomonas avellanae]EGH10572.1 hypothetical protein PSYMP_14059 [Pseudomonas amygdali pv. morsprunorum str. M302280]KWS60175.1 hypothetical protein AL055_29295 [Pseudomonas amygdali pv. morsprunorum]PHN47753.1 hypothetical protein AO261_04605 [Pseudomonas avellanae]POC92366.1 hypothetical protein BKM26_14880 [Pseudomonas avellanae]